MTIELERNPEFGFLQVRPTPSPEQITDYYTKEFYSTSYGGLNNSAIEVQVADKDFHDAHREDICANIEIVSGREISGLDVLDVGCGWAQTLLYMRQRGARCFGFDPAPSAVEYALSQGLNVRHAGMENLTVFPDRRFDVVMLLNVLEHLADPVDVMRQIRSNLLKVGGVLVIEVPNEFNAFQVCGQRVHHLPEWWVSPPAHLNYFSNDTLTALLQGTGFSVEHTESAFPMEMFLLFGENYVQDRETGKRCHQQRMAFERNLRDQGRGDVLREFYASLARQNLGRQIIAFAIAQ